MTDARIKKAARYVTKCAQGDAGPTQPCLYGHFDCALVAGGRCENEAFAVVGAALQLLHEGTLDAQQIEDWAEEVARMK